MLSLLLFAFLASLSDLKGQIDSLAKEYTANARTLSSEQKLSILRQIQQSYSKCKEFGDDKVQLAMQTYEMVSILSVSNVRENFDFLHIDDADCTLEDTWIGLLKFFFSCRSTNTFDVLTQIWPALRLT